MKHRIVFGALGAALLAGTLASPAEAVSPPVLTAEALAGPALTSEVQYRRSGRHYRHGYYRGRRSNVGGAVAAGAVLGLFGALATAAATPSYSYGYPYYADPYYRTSYYGYDYPAYSYPAYGYAPVGYPVTYGYAYPRRVYRGPVYGNRAYYGRRPYYGPRAYYGRQAYYPRGAYGGQYRGFDRGRYNGQRSDPLQWNKEPHWR